MFADVHRFFICGSYNGACYKEDDKKLQKWRYII